jgi:ABC-type multidrug transport system fused ATPase/permease subunit
MWAHRRKFYAGLSYAVLRCLVVAPFPWFFQNIIDVQFRNENISAIICLCIVFVGLLFFHFIFSIKGSHMLVKEVGEVGLEMRSGIFHKMRYLSFAYLDKEKTGRLLSKYAFDTQKVEMAMTQILNGIIPNLIYCLAVTIILFIMNWQIALIIIFTLPIFILSRKLFGELKEASAIVHTASERLTGTASEYISALKLVKTLGEELQVQEKLDNQSFNYESTRLQMASTMATFGTFTFITGQFFSLLIVAGGAIVAIHMNVSIGSIVASLSALPIILQPINLLVASIEQIINGEQSVRSITELVECVYVEEWKGQKMPHAKKWDIVFDGIDFEYPGTGKPVLSNFSLKIKGGEKVAFVGHSGSGKTTIVNLMLGLYKPSKGVISIDGISQSELNMHWLRRQVAVVMQDNILLSGTILENIKFSKPEASDDEVKAAAIHANADEFIALMPQSYKTVIGERGSTLSGGQKQRLAIARAILRSPPLLILDEATSALDYESERYVQKALDELMKDRTTVIIAHRLSTVKKADRIIALQDGKIVEEGKFDELASAGGVFSNLLESHELANGENS